MDRHALLQFARAAGFARNHLELQPSAGCRVPPLPPITDIREPFAFSAVNDDNLPLPPTPDEKLLLDKDTAAFLQTVVEAGHEQSSAEATLFLHDGGVTARALRWEEPLTRASPEPPASKKGRLGIGQETFTNAAVDEEGDGGLTWSSGTRRNVAAFERSTVYAEKLDMAEPALRLLRDVTRPQEPASDDALFHDATRPHILAPLTPPLLPMELDLQLPPIGNLSEFAPVNAGTSQELIDEVMAPFLADDAEMTSAAGSSSPSHFVQIGVEIPSPDRKRPLPDELKIEAPLTPPKSSPIKRVRFRDILAENIEILQPWMKGEDGKHETGEGDDVEGRESPKPDFMEDIARPAAVQVDRELGQEQLQQADSTLRVKVPVVDQTRPIPLWERKSNLENMRDVKSWAGVAAKKWSGIRSIEIDLKWAPFPLDFAKLPEEKITDGGEVDGFFVTEEDGENAEREILESMKIMTMNEQESEEEEILEYAQIWEKGNIGPNTLDDPPRRQKKTVGQEMDRREKIGKGNRVSGKKEVLAGIEKKKDVTAGRANSNSVEDSFQADNSLLSFMALRGQTLPLPPAKPAAKPAAPLISAEKHVTKTPSLQYSATVLAASPATVAPFPTPLATIPERPGLFMVSTTVLAQRSLFRHITALYPTARWIERDFSIPLPNSPTNPFTTNPASLLTPLEADLILSPRTGILLTTLRHLAQCGLPGEASPSAGAAIKTRIATLAARYENLLVLITHLPTPLSPVDAEVLASTHAFAAAVPGVAVRVIGGGEEDAARWVVAAMAREGTDAERLLQEETVWDVFLRVAGLNAFASQVVIAGCREVGGLRGFLAMNRGERMRRFAATVGERVMATVCAGLEGSWGAEGAD